jgi:D-inositol-3-phosphate glycosyltransferase
MSAVTIVHLIDDTTPGGVMRVLDHVCTHPVLGHDFQHEIRQVRRGSLSAPKVKADVIVSHLTINWRALPMLIQLRAMNAHVPMLHVEHSYTAGFVAHNVPSPWRFFTLLRTAYALFDKVAAVSAAQGNWLTARGLVDATRLVLLRSAVDVMPFLRLPLIDHAPKVIGAIGRLEAQKGFDILIKAFRATMRADLRLEIFGDGAERAALEILAGTDSRITFHGHINNPVAAMAAVDVVAMPSRWEAYGLVALEARAAGRGLLVSGVDGLADHLRDGAIRVDCSLGSWVGALEMLDGHVLAQAPRARLRAMRTPDDSSESWARLMMEMARQVESERMA